MQFGANGYPGNLVQFKNGITNSQYVEYRGSGANTPFWPAATGGKAAFRYSGLLINLFGEGSSDIRPGGNGFKLFQGASESIRRGFGGAPGLVRNSY
jgi:hypothetical protein